VLRGLPLPRLEVPEYREHAPVIGVGRRELQLLEDVLDVLLDGALRDHELFSDRRVRTPLGHQAEYLALARAEAGDGLLPARSRSTSRASPTASSIAPTTS